LKEKSLFFEGRKKSKGLLKMLVKELFKRIRFHCLTCESNGKGNDSKCLECTFDFEDNTLNWYVPDYSLIDGELGSLIVCMDDIEKDNSADRN
jgi:hypothetical protein